MSIERETWDSYFVRLALTVSSRATCTRRKVGAVICSDRHVISTGYNGSAPGEPHCLDVGCRLGGEGRCEATIHAEVNALDHAVLPSLAGSVMYVTDRPCLACARRVLQAGVTEVVFWRPYFFELETVTAEFSAHGALLRHYRPGGDQDLHGCDDPDPARMDVAPVSATARD